MKTNTEMARIAFRYCGGIAALFILITGKLAAQELKTEDKPGLRIVYQDDDQRFLSFKVAVINSDNKKTILRVSDNKDVLYSEVFNNELYTKTIRIPRNVVESGNIEFRLSCGKEVTRKTFEVKMITREVAELSVTELK